MLLMEIQPEKPEQERSDLGESVFPETDPIFFIFRFAYIPFVTHRDEYRVTQGSAVLTFIKIRCFTLKGLRDFTSSSGHETCLHFMILSF